MSELEIISLITGLVFVLCCGSGILFPESVRRFLKAFPRNYFFGWVLTIIDITWSAWLVYEQPMPRFDSFKPALFILTPAIILMAGFLMDELLAARALGGFSLLIAAPMLIAARFNPSTWSLIVSGLAYLFVVLGMVLVLNPYQFRKIMEFCSRSDRRWFMLARTGFVAGLLLIFAGLLVY